MKIDRYDWIVIISIVIKMFTIWLTALAAFLTSEASGASISETIQMFEANPMIRYLVDLHTAGFIMTMMIVPSIMFAGYFAVRKGLLRFYTNENMKEVYLTFVVLFIFFSSLANLMNDFGAVIGLMLRFG